MPRQVYMYYASQCGIKMVVVVLFCFFIGQSFQGRAPRSFPPPLPHTLAVGETAILLTTPLHPC